MVITPKTWKLLAVAIAALVLNLLPAGARFEAADLPTMTAVATDSVQRLEIARATVDKIVLERGDDGAWSVVAPFVAPADEGILRQVLKLYRDGLPMDALVDEGNLEEYGLDFQNGVVVELFTGAEVPAVSLVVGWDTRGGSSFVRMKDDEVVYHARVGGRQVYDRDAEDWRERMVMSVDAEDVIELSLERGGERWRFQAKDPNLGGGWSLVEDPDFDLDERTVAAAVQQLCTIRAGRILPADYDAGFDEPLATATLTFADGTSRALTLGGRSTDKVGYVKRDDQDFVYQVAGAYTQRLTRELADFKDLTVLSFDRGELVSARLVDAGVPITVAQESPGAFVVRDPPNVDLDQRLLLGAIATLADLRADAIAEVTAAEAGFDSPSATVTLRFADAGEAVLEIGDAFQDERGRALYYARVLDGDRVYTLRDATWKNVLRGFGR
jgi:hypothetical protein